MNDIFLSYSRKDLYYMHRIKLSLFNEGFSVWSDDSGLDTGTPSWTAAIQDAIDNSKCMVVILSPNAKLSKWVRTEITYADQIGIRIFPVLVDGDIKSSVPIQLIECQLTDIQTNYKEALDNIVSAIRRYLETTQDETQQIDKSLLEKIKQREVVRTNLSRYFSSHYVDQIMSNDLAINFSSKRDVITILFAEITGFSSLCEIQPPEVTEQIVRRYHSDMTRIIFNFNGHLNSYNGDTITAVFGAFVDKDSHAINAVNAAIQMTEKLINIQKEQMEQGLPVIGSMRIGIHIGDSFIGNVGTPNRMEFTVIGDHVDLCERVLKINKSLGTNILITESVQQAIEPLINTKDFGHVSVKKIGDYKVKGKEREVGIWSVENLYPFQQVSIVDKLFTKLK